ncbi:MAG TPA: aldehyde dehydrogenase family protein [Ktedonosporobacter sp.]|jgi:acyl-CoA reductase-like NAD-dependent aldehyde dehydrogenase|nr:aldehyde dehydrogenase family protein [Ktedonosporobacter sp.]
MTIDVRRGSPQFPAIAGSVAASSQKTLDAAVEVLQAHKDEWVNVAIPQRIAIIDQLIRDFAAIAPRWVAACARAKGIAADSPLVGEEWAAGTWPVLKNLRQLRQSLSDIEAHGAPRIPGPVKTRPDGQVVAQVFPQNAYDRLFFSGVTAELWMEPGVTAENLAQTQARVYKDKNHPGKVALVLGAGNVASIGPMDILYKMFNEDQVVLFKANPVNAYLGPLLEESFRALIEPGFLRIVYGGAAEGSYLCNHAGVDEIHITGSDKTFNAIVFGTGPEGAARRANKQPILDKRVTGELGNVSPVIVVPGPWRERDIAYHAEHIATMLTNNAGFNCNATRVILQHAGWKQREQLLQQIRSVLAQVPPRNSYYPGAKERHSSFIAEHPDAEQFGSATADQLPWTLITGVDPQNEDDICFTTEAFCGLFAETTIEAADAAEYLDRAVAFANEHIWGTLNATILIHPASLKDPAVAAALDRAVANLRYGSIGVNYWGGTSYALVVTTWGAFPGHTIDNIQSGTGVVHNTLLFEQPQKTVLCGPFIGVPTPPWFATRGKTARKLFPKLVAFEAAPSLWKIPDILWTAITG